MIKYIIVRENDKKGPDLQDDPERLVVSARDFIANTYAAEPQKGRRPRIINLCDNFGYLGKGYYVSLLAEARGLRPVPDVANIIALNWKRNYGSFLPELNELLARHYRAPPAEPVERTFLTFFGRHADPMLEPVARRLFDAFRFPAMSFTLSLTRGQKWHLSKVEPLSLSTLGDGQREGFLQALDKFTGTAWRLSSKPRAPGKKWIAILHDPAEKLPPSNKGALKKFVQVGGALGYEVELITRHDQAALLEYDALLLRETTAINHHTYTLALKAESEGIPCLDDTRSIIRCCNKVYLHELLGAKKIPMPRTVILERGARLEGREDITFPAVLKIPDGAFSRGTVKVDRPEDIKDAAARLLSKSEIILCQAFVPSEFDWRVGVLNGEPLFVLQYFMARGHWQIYNHAAASRAGREGASKSWPVDEAPPEVVETALKAAKLVGDGLYGVDLKQGPDGVVVIEVNDNPNIDQGVEDEIMKDALYEAVLRRLAAM